MYSRLILSLFVLIYIADSMEPLDPSHSPINRMAHAMLTELRDSTTTPPEVSTAGPQMAPSKVLPHTRPASRQAGQRLLPALAVLSHAL